MINHKKNAISKELQFRSNFRTVCCRALQRLLSSQLLRYWNAWW